MTPEERAIEEAERIERWFSKKQPHELTMQPARGSDIVATPGEVGDAAPDALGLAADGVGFDVAAAGAQLGPTKPTEAHVRRHRSE